MSVLVSSEERERERKNRSESAVICCVEGRVRKMQLQPSTLLVVLCLSCLVLSRLVSSVLVVSVSCRVVSCPVKSCLLLSSLALPYSLKCETMFFFHFFFMHSCLPSSSILCLPYVLLPSYPYPCAMALTLTPNPYS